MGYGEMILDGLWRFTAVHPEWEDEDDGWEPVVAWWAVQTDRGMLLIDPLVDDWDELDLVIDHGAGCAGVVRTCHWHQRSIAEAADRYAAEVWARAAATDGPPRPFDRAARPGHPLPGGLLTLDAVRNSEIAIWSPSHRTMLVGDVLIRDGDGRLRLCPDHWIEDAGGPDQVKADLAELLEFNVRHVLVSHGPLVLGDCPEALVEAIRI